MQSSLKRDVILYIVIFMGSLVLYIIGCAPGSLWQDSGLIQIRAWQGNMEGYWGLALAHPLYYLLALCFKWIPWGSFAYRVNMISCIAGALAVANSGLLVRRWTTHILPAVISAMTLALSHTFWRHACIAETYTLWAALFTLELNLFLGATSTKKMKYLYFLFLVNGLALAVHMFAVLPLICYMIYGLYLRQQHRMETKQALRCLGCWILGATPYLYLIVVTMIQSGDLLATLASALFGSNWQEQVLNTSLSYRMIKENGLFLLLNFPTPLILLFPLGLWQLIKVVHREAFNKGILVLTVLFFIFAFRYTVVDRYAFFVPFYCLTSVIMGAGVMWWIRVSQWPTVSRAAVLFIAMLPVGVYAVLPGFAERYHISLPTRGDIPYRNDYQYFLQPWRTGYTGADRFAREALDTVGPDAVICADLTTVGPLLYAQQVKGQRPDVRVVSPSLGDTNVLLFNEQTVAELIQTTPIFVVSNKLPYCPSFLQAHYTFRRSGHLWRVMNKAM